SSQADAFRRVERSPRGAPPAPAVGKREARAPGIANERARAGRKARRGPMWSPADVAHALVGAFAAMADIGIYSPRTNVLMTADCSCSRRFEVIAASTKYLGRQSAIRVHLLIWARTKALRESVRAITRDHGWSRSTLYRNRARGLAAIADGL